jgi:hypothetical protein
MSESKRQIPILAFEFWSLAKGAPGQFVSTKQYFVYLVPTDFVMTMMYAPTECELRAIQHLAGYGD